MFGGSKEDDGTSEIDLDACSLSFFDRYNMSEIASVEHWIACKFEFRQYYDGLSSPLSAVHTGLKQTCCSCDAK
jgi:hypothetical protein